MFGNCRGYKLGFLRNGDHRKIILLSWEACLDSELLWMNRFYSRLCLNPLNLQVNQGSFWYSRFGCQQSTTQSNFPNFQDFAMPRFCYHKSTKSRGWGIHQGLQLCEYYYERGREIWDFYCERGHRFWWFHFH